jgi:hypothetical protein
MLVRRGVFWCFSAKWCFLVRQGCALDCVCVIQVGVLGFVVRGLVSYLFDSCLLLEYVVNLNSTKSVK